MYQDLGIFEGRGNYKSPSNVWKYICSFLETFKIPSVARSPTLDF